ncbi:hypothetical protein NEF87_002956 [Candidatus Lokiarchaeum ossiferum]|uniref:Uncharacterized protein n=1 Tax=Candidatus Lokiarchaeum ossiferum TaxID=2951803 RepID=A0ABY6HTD1_9ARCH|nr:hypothetical protein NEF87_002956 [Candidatus Lokiarchaeum sp. B-35]
MSLLETAVFFQGETLLEKQFYAKTEQEMIPGRTNLIKAITTMAESAFDDEIKHFVVGDHEIMLKSHDIDPIDEDMAKMPLYMYAIAEKNINKKAVEDSMDEALFQFTNRFSTHDIMEKKKSLFQEFVDRFDKIFKGLIYTPDAKKTAKALKKMEEAQRYAERQAQRSQNYTNSINRF